jgi:alpha-D-ribose 1-methylphosphonate 5-triphosphate synthase subunit PhnI
MPRIRLLETAVEEAIEAAETLTKAYRLGQGKQTVSISPAMIQQQMRLLIDRVMSEGGLFAPGLAALALKQAEGDTFEAAFLLRAYRSTLARHHYSETVDPEQMRVIRRISSSFKDIPGGQVLGPTYDYTHRMLNFGLREEEIEDFLPPDIVPPDLQGTPLTYKKVLDILRQEGLVGDTPDVQRHQKDQKIQDDQCHHGDQVNQDDQTHRENQDSQKNIGHDVNPGAQYDQSGVREQHVLDSGDTKNANLEDEPFDITRERLPFPAPRSARLQALSRGETGVMTALAYSSMRGFGAVHPTIGELRVGYLPVYIPHPYLADEHVYIGEIFVTEVESINHFRENEETGNVEFTIGYGFCFGQNELKAISMAILDRSITDGGEAPAEDEEFVLTHIDSVESNGFVSHLKLPHYVTFQSALDRIRHTNDKKQTKTERR